MVKKMRPYFSDARGDFQQYILKTWPKYRKPMIFATSHFLNLEHKQLWNIAFFDIIEFPQINITLSLIEQ